ncbi:hypothetical protein [Deinococcus sonorensis]|uniref:Uncharacterized protein n=2 Tax=Deinococcus sonorensis TaxID=309891 RepID=A0AAU7UCU8_9DEIO
MRAGDALLLGLPLSLLVAGWSLSQRPETPELQPATLTCPAGTPPVSTQGNVRRRGSSEADFWANATLTLPVCGAGTLSLVASGTPAAGGAPLLLVSLDGEPLLETNVLAPRPLKVPVPHAGRLTLAFVNDLNRPPQDRNLFVKQLMFRPAGP